MDEQAKRWRDHAHAMQSGVATELEVSPQTAAASPKHLRTGLNAAMSDHGSLARLLITKGLITEEEYLKAIADGMQAEHERYEKHLSELLDRPITLG